MEQALRLLETHGYTVIFLVVLVDFLGAPITSIPLLVIGGALVAAGKLSFGSIVLMAALAAMLGDAVWFELGRFRGQTVLGSLCKLTRNRQACMERSTHLVGRYGVVSLLVSKFLPGVATFAPPAAGTARMPLLKFLIVDATGSVAWAASYAALGYFLSERTHAVIEAVESSGNWGLMAVASLAGVAIFLLLRKKAAVLRKQRLTEPIRLLMKQSDARTTES